MTTPILKLPEADQSQATLYPTHNEALRQLEVLLTRVLSMTTTAQPASPADGDAYIIPTGATGTDWATYTAGQIAWYSAGAWSATTAPDGLSVLVKDKNARYTVNAGAWALSITGAVSMADLLDGAQDLGTTTGLIYGYQGFRFGAAGTIDVPGGTVALTASATNYIEYDNTGSVSANTTGFTAGLMPMAEVVTSATGITSVTDKRAWLRGGLNLVIASELGGAYTTSSTTSSKIGTLTCTIVSTGNPVEVTWNIVVQKTGINANGAVLLYRDGASTGKTDWIIPNSKTDFTYFQGSFIDTPPAGSHAYEYYWNVESTSDSLSTVSSADSRFTRSISARELY
ncbi:DUF2793 domain-containing protein [Acidihalobacter prosperus]|uniref:DUF2793 domain-containing protein n=1 Tax=Acidihalobacter prosperus TaxID=160660 RepID=UPI0007EE7816|nr:DUF2793 domain-containing protein [Acidihalobacter prosperus]